MALKPKGSNTPGVHPRNNAPHTNNGTASRGLRCLDGKPVSPVLSPWDGSFSCPEREFHAALYTCGDAWNVKPAILNPPPSISYSRIPTLLYYSLDRLRHRDINGEKLRTPHPVNACFHLAFALGIELIVNEPSIKRIRNLRLRFLSSDPQGTAQEARIHDLLETGTPLDCPCMKKKHLNIRVTEHFMWGEEVPQENGKPSCHVTGFNEIKKELALDDRVLASVCGLAYLSRIDSTPAATKAEIMGYLSTFFSALREKARTLESMLEALEQSRGIDGDPLRGVERDCSIGDLYLKRYGSKLGGDV